MLFRTKDGRGVVVRAAPRRLKSLRSEERRKTLLRNANWWLLRSKGWTYVDIAESFGVSLPTVQVGVQCAEQLRLKLNRREEEHPDSIPIFGCEPWTDVLLHRKRECKDCDKKSVRPKAINASSQMQFAVTEELVPSAKRCRICQDEIDPGNIGVCMLCHESGQDEQFAEQILQDAIKHRGPFMPDAPAAKSKLHRDGATKEAKQPKGPTLPHSFRAELAETPQGYLFLKQIGQLPSEEAVKKREARRQARQKKKATK